MEAVYFSTVKETISFLQQNSSNGFVLFCSNDKIKQLSQFANNNVVFCSTAGEYTTEGYKKEVITGFKYDANEAEVVEILYPPIKSYDKLQEAYKKVEHNKNAFMLLLCDGLSGMEESIITTFFDVDDNFKIIGGSAGDYTKFEETLIYINNRKVQNAAIFFNTKQKTQIIKENIYEPLGTRLLVTEADPINRKVISFNNKPASTEYAKALGVKESELSSCFMNNPLGKIYKDNIFIASPMKINDDKSITFYSQIMPNTFVEILRPSDPLRVIKETFACSEFNPSFILVINCILRSIKFNQENIWKDIDREILKYSKNTTGFISYGEQFYRHHLNQTMVLLLVE